MSQLQPGDSAPDFTLPLDTGAQFRLADQRGHAVVLYFYPQDDTTGCINENIEFSELSAQFAALDAIVIGISPDSLSAHQKFRDKHGLKLPLAADPDRMAIEAYGLWQLKKLYGREFMGLVRTTAIISATGSIVAMIKATRIRGHAHKVLETLQLHLDQASSK